MLLGLALVGCGGNLSGGDSSALADTIHGGGDAQEWQDTQQQGQDLLGVRDSKPGDQLPPVDLTAAGDAQTNDLGGDALVQTAGKPTFELNAGTRSMSGNGFVMRATINFSGVRNGVSVGGGYTLSATVGAQ